MKDIKKEIFDALTKILKEEIGKDIVIKIDHPQDFSHGDYSTNISLIIFHKLKEKFKNPVDLASFIINKLQKKIPEIERIEVSPPGFLNFFLSKKYLINELHQIISKKNYGEGDSLKDKKIMIEFADPNPFKEFHIGHLRNISLGESYARLMEFQGASVWRVNYQGDVGLHVAKAIYGIQNSEFRIQNLRNKSVEEKSKFLGEAYAKGTKAYEESGKAKKEIQDLNIKTYQSDPSIREIWEKGRQWSLDHFEQIYKRVGTKYKRYYFESEVAKKGKEIVLSHLKDGIFERHAGAVVFRGGDHTRVFVTNQDYATYEAKDLALAKIKYQDFPYDQSIIITANEQKDYFRVVLKAMEKVFPDLAKKTIHQSFGFVNLKDGKMSSRAGNIIAGEWLLDEAKKRLKSQFEKMNAETLEKVAISAVKYSMLKFSRQSDIAFSFDESISLEGNSGPYLQYTHARTQSVLAKVKSQKSKVKSAGQKLKLEEEEIKLLRLLIHFGEIIVEAGENFTPNLLCNYLFDLSQKFNNFYQKHKIIGSKNEEFRLNLTSAVGQILKTGLYLLGIESPNKM